MNRNRDFAAGHQMGRIGMKGTDQEDYPQATSVSGEAHVAQDFLNSAAASRRWRLSSDSRLNLGIGGTGKSCCLALDHAQELVAVIHQAACQRLALGCSQHSSAPLNISS